MRWRKNIIKKKSERQQERENAGPKFDSFDEGDASESSSGSHPWCPQRDWQQILYILYVHVYV